MPEPKDSSTWSKVLRTFKGSNNRFELLQDQDEMDSNRDEAGEEVLEEKDIMFEIAGANDDGREDDDDYEEINDPTSQPSWSPTQINETEVPSASPSSRPPTVAPSEEEIIELCNVHEFTQDCWAGNITGTLPAGNFSGNVPEYVTALGCRENVTNSSKYGAAAYTLLVAKTAICSAVNHTYQALCYNQTNYTAPYDVEQLCNMTGNFTNITDPGSNTTLRGSPAVGPDFWDQHGLKFIIAAVGIVGICCAAACAKICCHTPVEIDRDTRGDGAIGTEEIELGEKYRQKSNQVAPYTGR